MGAIVKKGGLFVIKQEFFTGMNIVRFNRRDMPLWYAALGELDLEIVAAGFGKQVRAWKMHAAFSGDNYYRLYLPLRGTFCLEFEDRTWEITAGTVYLVPPGTPFSYRPVTPSDHYWIHFVSRKLATIPAGRELQFSRLDHPAKTRQAFQNTLNKIGSMTGITESLDARNSVFCLLAPLLEKILSGMPDPAAAGGVFAPVLDHVDEHLEAPLQVEDLRKLCGMGRAEFSACFRKTFGIPPKQYIVRRRMLRAKHLLWRTKLPVKEIAQQCGFADMRFFCRSFKKNTGMTPGAYRKSGGMD